MAKCPKCGKEIEKEGHHHCHACSLKHEAIRRGEGGLHWDYTIPLVVNSVLWRDLLFSLGIPVVIIAMIVVIFSNAPDRLMILTFFGALFIVFLFIALMVMVLLARSLGGGLKSTFYVNNAGVGFEAGKPAKLLGRTTSVLSLLSGIIGAAGENFLAIAREENFIAWGDIASVRIYHHQRVIHISSKEMNCPLALYCSSDNFERVKMMIATKVPQVIVRS